MMIVIETKTFNVNLQHNKFTYLDYSVFLLSSYIYIYSFFLSFFLSSSKISFFLFLFGKKTQERWEKKEITEEKENDRKRKKKKEKKSDGRNKK